MHPSDAYGEGRVHPDFSTLSRFALKEAGAAEASQVDSHLQECVACRVQAREIALIELGLSQLAPVNLTPQGPCPSPVEWARFAEGTIIPEERGTLVQHLVLCDDCLDHVLAVDRARRSAVPELALEQARNLSRLPPLRNPLVRWVLAPVNIPGWAAFSVSAALVCVMVLWIRLAFRPAPQDQQPHVPRGSSDQQLWQQLAHLKPAGGKAVMIPATPGLQQSVVDFRKQPGPAQQHQLLDRLKQLEPALPVQRIQSVTLSGGSAESKSDWMMLSWENNQLHIVLVSAPEKSPR